MNRATVHKAAAGGAVILALTLGQFAFHAPAAFAWLHEGHVTQYPSSGGAWEYGFWDLKVRSYYTANTCHGSSVKYNDNLVRSIDTASGKKSIAEKAAVNLPGNDDAYYYRTC